MRLKSSLDVFLVALAMVLLVIVGIGVLSRNGQQETAASSQPSTEDISAAPASDGVEVSGLGAEFGVAGSADESALGSDEAATLEEIEQPEEASVEWDLNGTFAVVRAIMNVNVRVGPSLDYGVMISVPNNTEVQVMRRSIDHEWIRVKLRDGREGWIFGSLLDLPN